MQIILYTYFILSTLNSQGNLDIMKIGYTKYIIRIQKWLCMVFHDLIFFKKSTEHKIVILSFYNMKIEGIIINRLGNPFVLACLL